MQQPHKLEILQRLLPEDALTTHSAPSGVSHLAVVEEKNAIFREMQLLANQFSDSSAELVQTAIHLAFTCHFNQFRKGTNPTHYTRHLLEVANRVNVNFDKFNLAYGSSHLDHKGHLIEPKAIALAVTLLHDALEDFHANFDEKKALQLNYTELAEELLTISLAQTVGESTANFIVSVIKLLSISNPDEFPTTDYINKIKNCPFALQCKLADIDHNASTFISYSPLYLLTIYPSQYHHMYVHSPYEDSITKNILRNLAVFNVAESAINYGYNRKLDWLVAFFSTYQETEAVAKITVFYTKLKADLYTEPLLTWLSSNGLESTKIDKQIEVLIGALK